MLHDKMVHGDEVHIREGHANDETPDTYERICRQVWCAHTRFRECFNLLSVFLSLLSTRVQLVHVWRVLDVIGWLRMPHSAAPTCRVLLHARLRRQRVLPSLSVCLTVLQETWLNPLLALVTTKRLRAHHMLKASPNHTASHLSICRMSFRLQGQVGETAKTRVQHIQAAQLSCPSWPPAVPSPAPDA